MGGLIRVPLLWEAFVPDLTIENVIRLLSADELIDAVETALEVDENGLRLWPILNEIERRDPHFEI
jgi:hypothetical protein